MASAVTVLLVLAPPDGTTRYVDQVVTCMPATVDIAYFSWRTALLGEYDVVHLHWPEFLCRGTRAPVRAVRSALLALLLLRLTVRKTPVVRTLHNERPHESSSRLEGLLLTTLDRRVTSYITLNHRTEVPAGRPSALIRHGDYVERFRDIVDARTVERVPGRVLLIGLLRPYKGIDTLVDAFAHSHLATELRIVGKPTSASFARELSASVENLPHVVTSFGFVGDDVMVDEIRAADLVVLPYRAIHNSGILFVALSVGTPVLASWSETVADLRDEVGSEWIQTTSAALTGADLDASLQRARQPRAERPTFTGRDWPTVAHAHSQVYRANR